VQILESSTNAITVLSISFSEIGALIITPCFNVSIFVMMRQDLTLQALLENKFPYLVLPYLSSFPPYELVLMPYHMQIKCCNTGNNSAKTSIAFLSAPIDSNTKLSMLANYLL